MFASVSVQELYKTWGGDQEDGFVAAKLLRS